MLDDSPPLQQQGSEQWNQCEWWRRSGTQVPPIISVEDLLSRWALLKVSKSADLSGGYRSRCFILDVRAFEDFEHCHFQSSASP